MFRVLLLLSVIPIASWAACPPTVERPDYRAALHTQLINAGTEAQADLIADRLWRIWLTAPDAQAQDLLDRSMARREAWDLAGSEQILDELIAYCPHYPEAYNQRAFTRFLREKFDGALADIDRVLSDNPYHFGALSGKAITLMRQGRMQLAQKTLRQAVEVHPFLPERRYLVETPDSDGI